MKIDLHQLIKICLTGLLKCAADGDTRVVNQKIHLAMRRHHRRWKRCHLLFAGHIQQMLADQRDCRDIVTQMSAASKALDQAGFLLVASGLSWCLANPEASAAAGYAIEDVQKMFMKLA